MKSLVESLNEYLISDQTDLFLFDGVNSYFSYVLNHFRDKMINIEGKTYTVCFILNKDDIKNILKNVKEKDSTMRSWFTLYPLDGFNKGNIDRLINDIETHPLDYIINKYKLKRIEDPKIIV